MQKTLCNVYSQEGRANKKARGVYKRHDHSLNPENERKAEATYV